MRLAILLVLAFVVFFSMWVITGMHIMRCALGITLTSDVELGGSANLGEWLLGIAEARKDKVPRYQQDGSVLF